MELSDIPEDLAESLEWPFDFAINDIPDDPLWFSAEPPTPMTAIAGEGTGGVYVRLDETGDTVFVDSEGAGSIVAPDLKTLMLIFVCHPYWRDLLKFSGSGSLDEMRRTLPYAAEEYFEDEPEVRELAAMLRERLRLGAKTDMVDVLHRAVSSTAARFRIIAPDGSELETLFNRFTVMDNPSWRKKAEQQHATDG